MTINAPYRRFSVEEYHRLAQLGILKEDDKVELIQGEIVEMSPIGPKHASTVTRIVRLLTEIFKDAYLISPQNPIQLGTESEPEPDVVILKERVDFYATGHPKAEDVIFIIEVADSTLQYDTAVKLPLYAQAGIAEYWIVDLQQHQLIIHTLPNQATYQQCQIFQIGEEVLSPVLPSPIALVDLIGDQQ
jgi:Uma2 family endonuclease